MIYIIVYEDFVLYETILINYLFKEKVKFVSADDIKTIKTFEKINITADLSIHNISLNKEDVLIIPGGNINNIANLNKLKEIVEYCFKNSIIIGAICSGVDYLHNLDNIKIHESVKTNTDKDLIINNNLITANPNAFIEFSIEIAHLKNIFKDTNDYNETYDFFMHRKKYKNFI